MRYVLNRFVSGVKIMDNDNLYAVYPSGMSRPLLSDGKKYSVSAFGLQSLPG